MQQSYGCTKRRTQNEMGEIKRLKLKVKNSIVALGWKQIAETLLPVTEAAVFKQRYGRRPVPQLLMPCDTKFLRAFAPPLQKKAFLHFKQRKSKADKSAKTKCR